MKHTVLPRPIVLPARQSRAQFTERTKAKTEMKTEATTSPGKFFVALGMRAGDLGYRHVLHEISRLGEVAHFNEGLLYLSTPLSIDQAFKRINKSIVDPRIPSDVGLLIVDPGNAHAKWYLNQEVSEILVSHWHHRTNLFVCHDRCSNEKLIYDINALGHAIPISEHIWYVSTVYAPQEAFQILSGSRDKADRITIFDATGRVKSWQSEQRTEQSTKRSSVTVQIEHEDPQLPRHATIHQPASWQASMLAEFL